MSSLSITGTVHKVFDTITVGANNFQKREFVLRTDENSPYPQLVKFELAQDKCSLIDGYQPGEIIDVKFNLRGREWTNPKGEVVYFNTLSPWAINRNAGMSSETPMPSSQMANSSGSAVPFNTEQESKEDDLPF